MSRLLSVIAVLLLAAALWNVGYAFGYRDGAECIALGVCK